MYKLSINHLPISYVCKLFSNDIWVAYSSLHFAPDSPLFSFCAFIVDGRCPRAWI